MMRCSTSHPPQFEDALHNSTARSLDLWRLWEWATSYFKQLSSDLPAHPAILHLCGLLWQARPSQIDNGCSDGIVTSGLLKPGGRD